MLRLGNIIVGNMRIFRFFIRCMFKEWIFLSSCLLSLYRSSILLEIRGLLYTWFTGSLKFSSTWFSNVFFWVSREFSPVHIGISRCVNHASLWFNFNLGLVLDMVVSTLLDVIEYHFPGLLLLKWVRNKWRLKPVIAISIRRRMIWNLTCWISIHLTRVLFNFEESFWVSFS